MCDPNQVTLLSAGRVLYTGACHGLAPWLEAAFGISYIPAVHGLPSDFALTTVSLEFGGAAGAAGGRPGVDGGPSAGQLAAAAALFKQQQRQLDRRQEAGAQWDWDKVDNLPGIAGSSTASSSSDGSTPVSASSSTSTICTTGSALLPLATPPQRPAALAPTHATATSHGNATAAALATTSAAAAGSSRRPFLSQISTLFHRELLLVTRNPADVAGRTLTFVWVAALVGFCYHAVPDSAGGIRTRLNILFSSLCFLLLMPFLSTSLLAGNKEAYARDVGARLYSPLAFYVAKVGAVRVGCMCFGERLGL